MSRSIAIGAVTVLMLHVAGQPAHALLFDQSVTNAAIFGSGNINGSYTVDRSNGVEIGLRAKLRFDAMNMPANTFNSLGNGDYAFSPGSPTGMGLPGWVDASTPFWNFEWSINTNYTGSAMPAYATVDDLKYSLVIDFDPSPAVSGPTFDPIATSMAIPFWDHSFGDNSTADNAGVEAGDAMTYTSHLATYNLVQNSWNVEFFDTPATAFVFDPNAYGTYTITLTAFDPMSMTTVASSTINVVVPEPAAYLYGGLICGVIGVVAVKRRFYSRQTLPMAAACK